jgi:hypothetical protein
MFFVLLFCLFSVQRYELFSNPVSSLALNLQKAGKDAPLGRSDGKSDRAEVQSYVLQLSPAALFRPGSASRKFPAPVSGLRGRVSSEILMLSTLRGRVSSEILIPVTP